MKKISTFWKVLGIIFISLIVLFLIGYVRVTISKDIPQADDSDLIVSKVDISQAENSYYDLEKIGKALYMPDETKLSEHLDGKVWDEAFVEDVLSKNQTSLSYFHDASTKSKFIDPAYSDPSKVTFDTPFGSMMTYRKAANLAKLQSITLSKQGKNKEAFSKALEIARVGDTISNAQMPLISYLVGLAIKNIGLSQMIKIAITDKESVKEFKADVEKISDSKDGLKYSLKYEYHNVKDTFDQGFDEAKNRAISSGKKIDPNIQEIKYLYYPNQTKKLHADLMRKMIENTDKSCGTTTKEAPRLTSDYQIINFFHQNYIGRVLVDMINISLWGVQEKRCNSVNLKNQLIEKLTTPWL